MTGVTVEWDCAGRSHDIFGEWDRTGCDPFTPVSHSSYGCYIGPASHPLAPSIRPPPARRAPSAALPCSKKFASCAAGRSSTTGKLLVPRILCTALLTLYLQPSLLQRRMREPRLHFALHFSSKQRAPVPLLALYRERTPSPHRRPGTPPVCPR